jgi:hypothetical protein
MAKKPRGFVEVASELPETPRRTRDRTEQVGTLATKHAKAARSPSARAADKKTALARINESLSANEKVKKSLGTGKKR